MNFGSGNESKTSRTPLRLWVAGAETRPSKSERPEYERNLREPDPKNVSLEKSKEVKQKITWWKLGDMEELV